MSVYFTEDVLPNLKVFVSGTEVMGVSHGLEELVVSVSGISVNKLFISLKHIEDIKIDIKIINIRMQIT